ncbi:MAG: GNAT family N-acetyltransferase [Haloarculaceae archaeon]
MSDDAGDDPTGEVSWITVEADFEAALALRREVFIEEQDVPEDLEIDGRDEEATHFLARADGDPVGTARLRDYGEGVAKVERVAVREPRRGEGWGERIMSAVEAYARDAGFDRVRLAAQVPVVGFYERLGYEVVSEAFMDAGIPHRSMEKPL